MTLQLKNFDRKAHLDEILSSFLVVEELIHNFCSILLKNVLLLLEEKLKKRGADSLVRLALAQRILLLRKLSNLTQEEIARTVKVARNIITYYEDGTHLPSESYLETLASLYSKGDEKLKKYIFDDLLALREEIKNSQNGNNTLNLHSLFEKEGYFPPNQVLYQLLKHGFTKMIVEPFKETYKTEFVEKKFISISFPVSEKERALLFQAKCLSLIQGERSLGILASEGLEVSLKEIEKQVSIIRNNLNLTELELYNTYSTISKSKLKHFKENCFRQASAGHFLTEVNINLYKKIRHYFYSTSFFLKYITLYITEHIVRYLKTPGWDIFEESIRNVN